MYPEAIVIGIVPFTDLYLLGRMYPEILQEVMLFLMGVCLSCQARFPGGFYFDFLFDNH
jgi:hypothetical protein